MPFKIIITEEDLFKYPNDFELGQFIRAKYNEYSNFTFDKCNICGEISPYKKGIFDEDRIGYSEEEGQSCFQEKICEKNLVGSN